MSARQATKRGMAHVAAELARAGARIGDDELLRVIPHADLPARPDVVHALGTSPTRPTLGWEADNLVNGANNIFNHQPWFSVPRLARLSLAGSACRWPPRGDRGTAGAGRSGPARVRRDHRRPGDGELGRAGGDRPAPAEIEQPVYDEATGEQTGTTMVPNPEIVGDEAERGRAGGDRPDPGRGESLVDAENAGA